MEKEVSKWSISTSIYQTLETPSGYGKCGKSIIILKPTFFYCKTVYNTITLHEQLWVVPGT